MTMNVRAEHVSPDIVEVNIDLATNKYHRLNVYVTTDGYDRKVKVRVEDSRERQTLVEHTVKGL